MDTPDLEASPQFSRPYRQALSMLIVLGGSAAGTVLALPAVLPVFLSNMYLNGAILVVFAIGCLACFYQIYQLNRSVRWIEAFAAGDREATDRAAPQMLAPLATLLRSRSQRMQIGASSTRSILDSVATRIDEAREVTRYIVGLLIFMGLLGTFYGLATTVPALVDTIRGLAPQDGETGVEVFARLMTGLESQLDGMGVAFASSLLGLAGSLIVGLLELFAGHGQNRFYRELEEWLSSITRLSFSSGEGEMTPDMGMAGIALDQMSEQIERLQEMFARSDSTRADVDDRLGKLADSVERLAERIEATSPSAHAMTRVAEGQEQLVQALQDRAASGQGGGDGMDAESRMRLRSIDVQMLRILEEISAGRQESMAELRTELGALTRALNNAARGAQMPVEPATRLNLKDPSATRKED
jgi:hypothetical protein